VAKQQRYPRLTPLRAFELLRGLDEQAGVVRGTGKVNSHVDNRARVELADHIRAALVKVRR
jgi:hypothetical protein